MNDVLITSVHHPAACIRAAVRPELMAEVEFRSSTADRLTRHASFRGLREDKLAEEVVLESKEEDVRD